MLIAPLCQAPVPGGCGRPCAKTPAGYRSMCSGHVVRKRRRKPLDTAIGSGSAGRPRAIERVDGLFPTTCPSCRVTRLRKRDPGQRRDCVCTSCHRRGKATVPRLVLPPYVIEAYKSGKSANILAPAFGCSVKAFLRAIQRQGVGTRTMSQAIQLTDAAKMLAAACARLRVSGEMSRRLSAGQQHIAMKDWTGFRADHWKRVRSSGEWAEWRNAVFARDGFRCVDCGAASTRQVPIDPHHIWPKARYPKRVFDVTNGVTLCRKCHLAVNGKERAAAPRFEKAVRGHKS